jgi:uncharacterized RmlC-like cupin family protein
LSTVEIIKRAPTKRDRAKGRWLLDAHELALPAGFEFVHEAFVGIDPGGWAANHRHRKREVLLGLSGDLWLMWRDERGVRHETAMLSGDGDLLFCVIGSNVPHLVENRSSELSSVLYEWSDGSDEAVMLEGAESLR